MSTVRWAGRGPAGTMEPLVDGSYVEDAIVTSYWRCEGCGLVWDRKAYALGCEKRGHRPSWEDGPYGVRYVQNGRLVGNLHYYTRRAVRKETLG